MAKPRSNNLQAHLNWALASDAFKPPPSYVNSPYFQRLSASREGEPIETPQIELTDNREKASREFDRVSPPPAVIEHVLSPSQTNNQEKSLPTPPSNGAEYPAFQLSSDPDSDLEYLASLPKVRANKSHVKPNKEEDVVIAISSSEPEVEEESQISPSAPDPPLYRFSQAPQAAEPELPRQELGSVFSEKIALLEQKVKQLSLCLKNNGISYETREIDDKIREVERRIEQFPGDDDDSFEQQFNLSSSPQAIMYSRGLPLEINNDQFDSDFPGDSQQSPTKPRNTTINFEPREPILIDSYEDDFHGKIVENGAQTFDIEEVDHRTRQDPLSMNSFGDEPSVYSNLLNEDSLVIETQSNPQRTAMLSQGTPQTPAAAPLPISRSVQPWHKEMMHILRSRFGLQGFRPNQAEAINETLSGNDVVVLMPTGGGKSLCYQLPALVSAGKTHGTTVVISPLISLMQDQVYHLKNRSIPAEMLNSKLTAAERSAVLSLLNSGELKLLYISPEMLSASAVVRSALQKLYSGNQLARIVIDEAHCVSAWGHDFRPDYMELTKVKIEYPTTPIMALTATANERVLLDIVGCLRSNPIVLKQSFNRKNLYYEVRPKTANVIQEIASVCGTYFGKSGIIYCNSKKNCEDTAGSLKQMGVKAEFYHAGMEQNDRAHVQQLWQTGKCTVVCATIAFGMGIDKPDVRFVMHLTLPRNIEGYYQETGRAGRDGNFSHCILFYSYRDVQVLQKMIQQDNQLSYQVREHHKTLLIRVMQYCENKTDCRRQQVLQYFNEDFDSRLCRQQCDNCRNMRNQGVVKKDMTTEAKSIVAIVEDIAAQHITTQQTTDVLLGKRTQKVKSCGFDKMPWFAMLQSQGPLLVERLVHALISERVLEEYSQYNHSRFPQSYVKLGPKASAVQMGKMPIYLSMAKENDTHSSVPATSYESANRKKRITSRASGFRNFKRSRRT